MTEDKEKFNRFSVGLGLLDYVNPVLYSVTALTIIINISKLMTLPYSIFYIAGAVISIIFGFCIPTVKVLIGLGKIKFKLPVMFVFLVNSGLFISGLVHLKEVVDLSPYILLAMALAAIVLLFLIYRKTKRFNDIAVLTGFIGYLAIYISLFALALKDRVTISVVLLGIAIILFLFLIGIGLKADLKKAKIHWIIESTNIICQFCVAAGTVLIMLSIH